MYNSNYSFSGRVLRIDFEKLKPWVIPSTAIVSVSILLLLFTRGVDILLYHFNANVFGALYTQDAGNLTNTIGGLGELVSAIMGIEITVLAIIVQLAANKYSSKIMELFIQNRINIIVIMLYVITAIFTVVVCNTVTGVNVPYFSITFCLLLILLCLIIVIPHFNYVSNFLRPNYFITYVQDKIDSDLRTIVKVTEETDGNPPLSVVSERKDSIAENINFIGDIALNSVIQGDRATVLLCVATLKSLTVDYLPLKKSLPGSWFKFSGLAYYDPDFSSYSRFVLSVIERKKIFLERKVFRLFEMLYTNSRVSLRDVASGVLLNSELIGSGAMKESDNGALHCTFQYFNSYLRIAIRERDPRSAFNTLEHYRVLAEELLDVNHKMVETIFFYFKYYGQEANKFQVLFILETAAHDLCVLMELAYEKQVPNQAALLRLFLTVDEPIEESKEKGSSKEASLIGVRVAQAKLAGFYLLNGEETMAKVIFEDMKFEPYARILKIQELIENTKEEEFWEITPRGVNFNYVSEERRQALRTFFGWFEEKEVKES